MLDTNIWPNRFPGYRTLLARPHLIISHSAACRGFLLKLWVWGKIFKKLRSCLVHALYVTASQNACCHSFQWKSIDEYYMVALNCHSNHCMMRLQKTIPQSDYVAYTCNFATFQQILQILQILQQKHAYQHTNGLVLPIQPQICLIEDSLPHAHQVFR